MKLMEYIYQVGGVSLSHSFDATAYLIEGENGLYLVDCGTPDGFEQILSNIQKAGFDPARIKAIYGTHGHYDHVGAASLFKEKYGSKLYLHEADKEQVEQANPIQTTAQLLYGKDFPACKVDGCLTDGQRIEFRKDLSIEVITTPGHTMGSVCFSVNARGFLFLIAGDTLHGGFSPEIGSSVECWKASLERLTDRHFDAFTFGHMGANVICDADARIVELKKQFATYFNPWFKAMKDSFRYA